MSVVYTLFEENGYKLPERIEYGIRTLFPKFRIGFERGFSGEIVLRIYEDDHVLYPPSIPDGFYKVLAILTAIELKPSILAIDEIENSLHAEALEYVIDELKDSESTVIIATHSPVVVDIVDLEDLIIVEKDEGTRLRRVEEPEKVREELEELGITPSESWLYGGKL
jgi:predicted ATPase